MNWFNIFNSEDKDYDDEPAREQGNSGEDTGDSGGRDYGKDED